MMIDVQIFGMPRSGTNLIEWSLLNHFKGIDFHAEPKKCDVPMLKTRNRQVAAKHSIPGFENADKVILIYKRFRMWSDSYKAYYPRYPRAVHFPIWRYVMSAYANLAERVPERCLLVEYTDFIDHYPGFVAKVASLFGFRTVEVDEYVLPKRKMGRRNGRDVTGKPFVADVRRSVGLLERRMERRLDSCRDKLAG